jgi:hypothetical protein
MPRMARAIACSFIVRRTKNERIANFGGGGLPAPGVGQVYNLL